MPPQSRGNSLPPGFHSKSTPNLPTLSSLSSDLSPAPDPPSAKTTDAPSNPLSPADNTTSPSEPASIEDNLSTEDPFTLDASGTSSPTDDEFEINFENNAVNGNSSSPGGSAGGGGGGSTGGGRSTSTGGANSKQPRRPLYSHTSRSHSHLPHTSSALFPPFYNRPPTPLPPSPSLTSLLRPSFSTQTSRPTTPDSSDVEGVSGAPPGVGGRRDGSSTINGAGSSSGGLAGKRAPSATSGASNGTGTPTNNLASSFASATPIPRASPKVPTYEYYGFFIYLASSFAFLMYLLWAYLPRPFLHQLGIYYYPNRWWALAVPAWLVVLVVYIYVALASYNLGYMTLPMRSIENLVDETAQIAVLDSKGRIVRKGKDGKQLSGKNAGGGRHDRKGSLIGKSLFAVEPGQHVEWGSLWSEDTDAVLDVPIGGVCEILYGDGRGMDDDEDMDGHVNGTT